MKLHLQQHLPTSLEQAWWLIADPAQMCRWSEARIELVAAGDGGLPFGVGTYRKVHIEAFGRRQVLKEVITHSEPPHRLVYRVFDTPPIEAHRGEMQLVAEGDGVLLSWQVEARYSVGAVEWFARRLLETQLSQSLRQMAQIAAQAPQAAAFDGPSPHLPAEPLDGLWDEAQEILELQRRWAQRLKGDPKGYFAAVYQRVTEAQIQACREGAVTHIGWVLRLIPLFHIYYADNLERWLGEDPGPVEQHWKRAFQTMERPSVYGGLLQAIEAHVEEDLPRVLAQVYRRHYAGLCDYDRFRADFMLMGGIFQQASEQMLEQLPRLAWYMKPRSGTLWKLLQRRQFEKFYPISRRRWLAFERGKRLAHFSPQAAHFDDLTT